MADQPVHGDHCKSESRRKGTSGGAGRPTSNTEAAATTNNSSTSSTPAYSNNSSASTNLINMCSFTSNFDLAAKTAPSSQSLDPLQLSRPSQDEEDDEEESQVPLMFANDRYT
ncbi:hypothetical protein ACE6H2_022801 [Prunus campanulata]